MALSKLSRMRKDNAVFAHIWMRRRAVSECVSKQVARIGRCSHRTSCRTGRVECARHCIGLCVVIVCFMHIENVIGN